MDLPSVAQRLTPEIQFLYARRRGKERLGLDSTRRLLQRLGEPQRDVPVLHVAGTNGKGSTTALAASMLQSAGLRVGRFTSPHLLGVEERICVDGVALDFDVLRARVRDMRSAIQGADASFFESITALAACTFRDARVDVAVYEVGLGGRLDSTNVMPAAACVVTGIGHDHESILGRGLRAICAEKLGIVRPGVPLSAALTRSDLVQLAQTHCERVGASLHLLPRNAVRVRDMSLDSGMRFDLRSDATHLSLWTRFLGEHQASNAALAALAVRDLLRRRFPSRAWDLEEAVARAFLPGRFQVLPAERGEPTVVLDVAHNPQSLRATLDIAVRVFSAPRPTVVLGMLRDKQLTGVLPRLQRAAARVVLTTPRVARAWDPHAIAPRLRALLDGVAVEVEPHAEAALARACAAAEPVLVLGSHYLIGELIPSLARRRGTTAEALVAGSSRATATQAAG
jgi:dihydrofolate synthase/folylpolyglutamate synthase